MILEEETFDEFGYYPRDLKPQSSKRILVRCDKCKKIREVRRQSYSTLCMSCVQKSREREQKGTYPIEEGMLEQETFEKFGYYPSQLKPESGKIILAACDKCERIRETSKHNYRDLCTLCVKRGKKRKLEPKDSYPIKSGMLEEETFKIFGYYPSQLTPMSGRMILVKCNSCGKIRENIKCQYREQCISCTLKGNTHSGGNKISEETRNKISIAQTGKEFSEKTRIKLSIAKIGKEFSEEHCKNISIAKKNCSEETKNKLKVAAIGRTFSEETRKKMGISRTGERNGSWKGGISFEPYCSKFNNQFKEYIRDKFGRVCFICDKTEEENKRRLSVHHVNYDKDCICNDNITCQFVPLCMECNTKVNFNRELWEEKINMKMKNQLTGWYV